MHLNLFMGVTCMIIAVSDISFLNIKGPNCSLRLSIPLLDLGFQSFHCLKRKREIQFSYLYRKLTKMRLTSSTIFWGYFQIVCIYYCAHLQWNLLYLVFLSDLQNKCFLKIFLINALFLCLCYFYVYIYVQFFWQYKHI